MIGQRHKAGLGELLVQQGLITRDQLAIALAEQRHHDVPLGRLLVRLGFVAEPAIRDIMARSIGRESIDLSDLINSRLRWPNSVTTTCRSDGSWCVSGSSPNRPSATSWRARSDGSRSICPI